MSRSSKRLGETIPARAAHRQGVRRLSFEELERRDVPSTSPIGFTPAQIKHAYGFDQIQFHPPGGSPVAGDGAGQTIAIVDAYDNPRFDQSSASDFAFGDLHKFDVQFGLPDPVFVKMGVNFGPVPGVDPQGPGVITNGKPNWESEEALDVEWAHAIAPAAAIILVEVASASSSDLLAGAEFAKTISGVSVVSMSWGRHEYPDEAGNDSIFAPTADNPNVAFVASSGDDGDPQYPAVSPNVLGVGGTKLTLDANSNITAESAWNFTNINNQPAGGGGGGSGFEPAPPYQASFSPNNIRLIPDVSYDGDPATPFAVYDSYNDPNNQGAWTGGSGTSAGAPQWAALVAIADQGRAEENNQPPLNPDQLLNDIYSIPRTYLNDIVSGVGKYSPAQPGYDTATGLGTPNAYAVVEGLMGNCIAAPPVAFPDTNHASPPNTPLTDLTKGVLANDSASGEAPSLLEAVLDSGPQHGQVTLNENGTFVYVPNNGFRGYDQFTYHAHDRDGNSASVPVSIHVGLPPTANNDLNYTVPKDGTLFVDAPTGLLANDTDPENDPTFVHPDPVPGGGPFDGQAKLNGDGSFLYAPDPGFHGTDGFQYTAYDADGTSTIATVLITVQGDVPAASDASYSAAENQAFAVLAPQGLGQFVTDTEHDPLTFGLAPGGGPAHGSVVINPDGSFDYTPATGFRGTDSFEYTARDIDGTSQPVTVTITVTGVPPTAVNHTYYFEAGAPTGPSAVTLDVPVPTGLLFNAADAEGDKLTAVVSGDPQHGTLNVNPANGSFTYTLVPTSAANPLPDKFFYRVQDQDGLSDPAEVDLLPTAVKFFRVDLPADAQAATGFTVKVTAVDPNANPVTDYRGTVHFDSDDPKAELPPDYTFTAADQGTHTFQVRLNTAGEEQLRVGDQTLHVAEQLLVNVTSGPPASMNASAPPGDAAGVPFTLTVTATDLVGNVVPGYTGTVHFGSSDGTAVLPPDYTFTAADRGKHTFFNGVVLRKVGATLTFGDAANPSVSGGASPSLAPGAAATLRVGAPARGTAGNGFAVTVTALDAFGNTATGFVGTVHLSATDGLANLPADYTFTAADAGIHTFTGLVLKTAGTQVVTAAAAGLPTEGTGGVVSVAPVYNAAAVGAGGPPEVKVYDAVTGAMRFDFLAYDPSFLGGVSVAIGDVTGDGVPDIITGAGPGGGPHVKVFDGVTGAEVRSFFAYESSFRGGVSVAVADLDGDGHVDVITGSGAGGGPRIEAFGGRDGSLLWSRFAYDPSFRGGVSVAAGDIDGDGIPDLVTGAGPGGAPHVEVFEGQSQTLTHSFFAYDPSFTSGVFVTVADRNGDGIPDVVTSAGPDGAQVEVFSFATGNAG
jgi:hypothetical protein